MRICGLSRVLDQRVVGCQLEGKDQQQNPKSMCMILTIYYVIKNLAWRAGCNWEFYIYKIFFGLWEVCFPTVIAEKPLKVLGYKFMSPGWFHFGKEKALSPCSYLFSYHSVGIYRVSGGILNASYSFNLISFNQNSSLEVGSVFPMYICGIKKVKQLDQGHGTQEWQVWNSSLARFYFKARSLCFFLFLLWTFVLLSVSFSPHTHIRRHTCTRAGVHTQKDDRKGTHQNVNSNCLRW